MVRQVAGNSRALIFRSSQRHPTFTRMMITTPLLPGLIYIIFTFSWNFRSIFFSVRFIFDLSIEYEPWNSYEVQKKKKRTRFEKTRALFTVSFSLGYDR